LRFLRAQGIENITVLDKDNIIEQGKNITYITGEKYLDSLGEFDVILKSP
jgi:hypothetical protein